MEKETQKIFTKPPVVVIMGHVDSGKTSLLNSIRQLQFSEQKPGGTITQHILTCQVEKADKKITFIDTPGHEAFSKMRSRGAKIADIAVLVIDAVEGIKEQTKEAIAHIKKAGIPMIVAINKTDKIEANPEKLKRELKTEGVLIEEFGGDVPVIETSAKTKEGIDGLLDLILLLAEMKEIRVNLDKPGEGTVIESYLDPKRGVIASIILEDGILKTGDIVGTETVLGRVKRLENFQKKEVKEVTPGQPVFLLGLESLPVVGEKISVFPNMQEAKKALKKKEEKIKFLQKTDKKTVNLILKADSLGSIEAIKEFLKSLSQKEMGLQIISTGIGEVNENDIELAKTGKAVIFTFKTKIGATTKALSQREKIKVKNFDVIYDLIEGIKKIIEKDLAPKTKKIEVGRLKVLVDFWRQKNRQIVGGRVTEGRLEKGTTIEVLRENESLGEGKVVNLQKNKKDIGSAKKGEEAGVLFEGNVKIEKGDILIFYKEEKQLNNE